MLFEDLNPFLRFAGLQPFVFEGNGFRKNYDCRLFYIISGEGTVFINEEQFSVKEGCILYLPPAISYYFEGKLRVIVLNFDMTKSFKEKREPKQPDPVAVFRPDSLFDTSVPSELEKPIICENAAYLRERTEEILFEHQRGTEVSPHKVSGLIKALLCDILITKGTSAYGPLIDQVMSYIIANCSQKLSNTDIAQHFNYNPEYLCRIFKKQTGYTMHGFLLNQRILVATRVLRHTSLPIEAVAETCGFSDRIQFYTSFKKQMGVSPITFRKSLTK